MEVIQTQPIVSDQNIFKTPSYTLRATRKYREKNREKLNEYARNRIKEKYSNDPVFREEQKKKTKERYYKKNGLDKIAKEDVPNFFADYGFK
jgi:hypothetical protein